MDERSALRRSIEGRSQARSCFAFSQSAKARNGGQVLGAGTDRANFPVVDRLGRSTDEEAALGRRKAQSLALRNQTLGAEPQPFGWYRFALGRRRLPLALAQAAEVVLEFLRATLERCDLGAVGPRRLPEGKSLAAHLFSGDAGNLAFEESCNVWHGSHCA